MGNVVLLLGLFGVAAVFVGIVLTLRARRPVTTREDNMFSDGIVLAVLIPIFGLIWAARLFAKERYGPGLALVTISIAAMLAYLYFGYLFAKPA